MKFASVLLTLLIVAPVAGAHSPDGRASSAEIVDRMVAAHGGMEAWAAAPTVSFEDEFRIGTTESAQPSRITVEQGRRRAYLDFPGTPATIAWDGEKAWSQNWASPYPPRFLALLNFHFLNLPWLAKDPGVELGDAGRGRLWDDPLDYLTIKITYGEGVGDTPDDYYILYIHPVTHRLKATEYIVTYSALLPEGVEASSPHILVYDEFVRVSGLLVPSHYTIYEGDHSVFATCPVRDWSFERPFDPERMTMPEGAVVVDALVVPKASRAHS